MKLVSLQVRNLRGIEDRVFDFRDDIGLIRDRIPIVGPNATGKTTILDAIVFCLLPLSSSTQRAEPMVNGKLIREGADETTVRATVWLTEDEQTDSTGPNLLEIEWTFPDPDGISAGGAYQVAPEICVNSKNRSSVILFEQERTGKSGQRTLDDKSSLARLSELYARICAPHAIVNAPTPVAVKELRFHTPTGTCFWDGLSTGERILVELLLPFASGEIHSSIVLIDELELHLHPLWQDRLYSALLDLGTDNQIIFTTHSTHLRDTIRDPIYSTTGEFITAR